MSDPINSLPTDLQQFVDEQVATGAYVSPEAVVRDALERLRQREQSREQRLEAIRREVQVGLEQADNGESSELDMDAIKRAARNQWSQQADSR